MEIRLAKFEELNRILEIYAYARNFMVETGNRNQWLDGYPVKEMLEDDIAAKTLYVMEEDAHIYGVFAFVIGDDPTYTVIEKGTWRSNELYGTIHRIASSGEKHGLLDQCVEFCLTKMNYLRIDTHHDNKVMQKKILQNGFESCGIIYAIDGNPRIAYDLMKLP